MSVVKEWITEHGDEVEVWSSERRSGPGQEYRWRVRAAGNHEIVGQGEGHPNLTDAVRAAERHHPPVASEE